MTELQALTSEAFLLSAMDATPDALHRSLVRSPFVTALTRAISAGDVQEADISSFVNAMLRQYDPIGASFPRDVTLAAIGVAIQGRSTAFAEDYFQRVAKARGLALAAGVARICMRLRAQYVPSISLVRNEMPFPPCDTASTVIFIGMA